MTLNINEVKRYTEAVPESTGEQILKGLSDNGRRLAEGLKNFGIRVIVTSPFWITAAAIGAVAGCLVWKIRKSFKKRKAGKKATGKETGTKTPLTRQQEPDQGTDDK